MRRTLLAAAIVACLATAARAGGPSEAVIDLDCSRPVEGLRLRHGARVADAGSIGKRISPCQRLPAPSTTRAP